MKLYLAGPMTNRPKHNYLTFHAVAAELRDLGHEVVSPAELHPEAIHIGAEKAAAKYTRYLRADFAALVECEGVALLPGFLESRGAMWELHTALMFGLRVFHVEGMREYSRIEVEALLYNYFASLDFERTALSL